MPAICPPLSPSLLLPLDAPLVVAPGVAVAETVSVTGASDSAAITGSWTPSHRSSVLEKTQQESVELGELAEQ